MAKNIFQSVQIQSPGSNKFDLTHERKMSMNMGELIPFMMQEVLPGDKWRVSSEIFMRMAPMVAPMMHHVNIYTHFFFVPNRLVWNEWEDFITGGKDGTLEPTFPYILLNTDKADFFTVGSLADYMGLPTMDASVTVTNPVNIGALPFRSYATIYNEYYRDQNLSDPLPFSIGSGLVSDADAGELLTKRQRAWEKDYFTSALPFTQRGPDVNIPMSGIATAGDIDYKDVSRVYDFTGVPINTSSLLGNLAAGTPGDLQVNKPSAAGAGNPGRIENIDSITVDNISATINELRKAVSLQTFFEIAARVGSRYTEQLRGYWGVTSSDARLQRPEYLGGGRAPLVISEVLQTAQPPEDSSDPLASMAGHGIGVGNTNRFSRFFEEHGLIIGIMSVLPKTAYQQGIPRYFRRKERLDFAFPQFAHLGEQEILNSEIYYDPATSPDIKDQTFGYTPRYAEYKYIPSTVHGVFRSTLDYWHMGRIFTGQPNLNEEFVMSDPTKRIFAIDDPQVESLYCSVVNHVSTIRSLPYFGTPKLL